MSDDLVKRARHNALADMPHFASVELIEALADRIEEPEAKLDWVIVERDETFALMLDRAQTAEAKLAKLAHAAKPFAAIKIKDGRSQAGEIGRTDVTNIRATLAELKGDPDA